MTPFPYLLIFLIPASAFAGIAMGGVFTYLTPVLSFVLLPIADAIAGTDPSNPAPDVFEKLERMRSFRVILYCYVPVHLALIFFGAQAFAATGRIVAERIGILLSVGTATGAIGITAAHELVHKPARIEKFAGHLLLLGVCYLHFAIEHVAGHHTRVATPEDPATARFGESFYRYWPRTVFGGYISAWRIESRRLRREGRPFLGPHNRMIVYALVSAAAIGGMYAGFGPAGTFFFLGQSGIAFSLLELINYIEHYGLERKPDGRGGYERVDARHSWDSTHRLTNYFLFKLQRHADHHLHPIRRYQTLRADDESPTLPTGYAGMAMMALVPPLWRRVMHPRLEKIRIRA